MKLNAKTARESLPAEVSARLLELAKEYKTRRLSFDLCSMLYVVEDANYSVFHNGESRAVRAGGEWNGIGPCNADITIPAGAYVIERRWFMGSVFLTVYHNNGQAQIA